MMSAKAPSGRVSYEPSVCKVRRCGTIPRMGQASHCHPASQHYRIGRMPDPVDPKAFLTLVELAIGNMYEVEAIGEVARTERGADQG